MVPLVGGSDPGRDALSTEFHSSDLAFFDFLKNEVHLEDSDDPLKELVEPIVEVTVAKRRDVIEEILEQLK